MFHYHLQRTLPATGLRIKARSSLRAFTQIPRRLDQQQKPVTTDYQAPPAPPSRTTGTQLPFLSLVAIFCLGSFSFYWLTKQREGTGSSHYALPEKAPSPMPAIDKNNPALQAPKRTSPLFQSGTSENQALVVFVLGGPGAGKGTQCANLVRDYGFTHLSAGDLLRSEQDRPGSEFGEMIKTYIKEGQIVPMEVTIQLLENAMTETIEKSGNRKFLIDGFPRKMDQAVKFEEVVVPSKFTLFFDCDEKTMRERLLERGKSSGRADDNEESIKKRFRTFIETSMPVVEHFEKDGKVVKVDATKGVDEVYSHVREKFGERGLEPERK